MNTSVKELIDEYRKYWRERDPAGDICIRILEYINAEPREKLEMLTFAALRDILDKECIDDDTMRALSLLTSAKVHALEMQYQFIDDENQDESYEVSSADICEAKKSDVFIHPRTGKEIMDWDQKIIPYFVLSDHMRRLKKG